MSFRRRLALLSAGAVALVVVGSAVAVYLIARQQLYDDVSDQLRARAAVQATRGFADVGKPRPGQARVRGRRPPRHG